MIFFSKENKLITLVFLTFHFVSVSQIDLAKYVNPFIGSGGTGHTFPGPVMPFGMVQLSPDTRIDGSWEGCSGYYYPDTLLYGFSHTHLSGTGCSDYGDILFMPSLDTLSDPNKFKSRFFHSKENASAGFYSLELNQNLNIELTSTTRVGIQKYSVRNKAKIRVLLDLKHRDKLVDGNINIIDKESVEGYRVSAAWASKQELFFHAQFSKPFNVIKEIKENEKIVSLIMEFSLSENEELIIKTALSPTSEKGALKNLKIEASHWDFKLYKANAFRTWNNELSKILVESPNENKKIVFYTSLYHCMIHPSINMDVDSLYKGRDGKIHKAEGFAYYSVFSLWDTFRAEHPLLTLIDEQRTRDFLKTFLRQFEEGGRLPVWELSCNETDCMIGYHSIPVIVDAVNKNIITTEIEAYFRACEASAMADNRGVSAMKKNQFLSIEDDAESVSKSLEYAYDDWCIAQLAKKLNDEKKYKYYIQRSKSFLNLFDASTGFMRPRKNGDWLSPFDPTEVNNHFTEANSWQYSFFVPHDLQTLIHAHGGQENFLKKLDQMFSSDSKTSGRDQADITGLIGQYAHGNEPSHHITYVYNSVGRNDKTAILVQKIMNEFYKNDPDGLIGNEDCGQMSAWYVLSAMGLYPALPGTPYYHLGSSIFNKIKINTKNRNVEITNSNNDNENIFINDWQKDGKNYKRSYIMQNELNGNITFNYSKIVNDFAVKKTEYFLSEEKTEYIPAPLIKARNTSFEKETEITIQAIGNYNVFYSFKEGENNFEKYQNPFKLKNSTTIRAYSQNSNGEKSAITSCTINKKPNQWRVKLINCSYNKQYTAGGDEGIIDGQFANTNWRIGGWQGYQSQDFTSVIDLGKIQDVTSVGANFLQDTRSWIIFPKTISIDVSIDGIKFVSVGNQTNRIAADNYDLLTQKMEINFNKMKARFIKIKAVNFGKLPDWHQGHGGDAFIFIDEVWCK